MTTRIFPEDWERLSAYLDGQLPEREKEEIRQRLETQPELQRALEELRRTKMVLRSAPRRRVPHNFTLTPAMLPQRKSWFPLVPVFSFASAMALILLVFSIGFSLLPGLTNATEMMAPAPAAQAPLRSSAAQAPAPTQAPAASDQAGSGGLPPIIEWGAPPGIGGGSGGGSSQDTPAASGMGGGPGQNITAETPAAPQVANPAALPTETPVPASLDSTQKSAPLEGSGPILGVRPTQEMGKIVVDQGADQFYAADATPVPEQAPSFLTRNMTAIQVGLLVLALGAGLAAFLLRRRS